jgi:hypothetical protein
MPVLVPWAAALLLLVVLVRQQPQTDGAAGVDATSAARSAVSVSLMSGVRGPADSSTAAVLPPDSIVFLSVDVPADGAYDWTVRSVASVAEADPLFHGSGKAQNGALAISVDTHRLKPDDYVLSVRQAGLAPSSGRSYSFSLKPSR